MHFPFKKHTYIRTDMKYILPILGLCLSFTVFAQDSTLIQHNFDFEARAKHVIYGNNKEVINSRTYPVVTDNPFSHMAVYAAVYYKPVYNRKYEFDLALFAEERSHSGGNNFYGNIRIFPKITIAANDTFNLGFGEVKLYGFAGDLWDVEYDDKLRIYNLDYNGLHFKLGIKNYWIGYSRIADLSYNTGLGLHEFEKLFIEYIADKVSVSTAIELNYRDNIPEKNYNWNTFFTYTLSAKEKIQTQLNFRFRDILGVLSPALFAGYKTEKENYTLTTNLRYYTARFNAGYKNENKIQYRGNSASPYVGRQLYPLKNYYRPLNQWAFFTELENMNILNLELILNYKKLIYKNIGFELDIDVNLNLADNVFRIYPLYEAGLAFNALPFFKAKISGTNKHMNLDSFYQAFYISKIPLLSIGIAKVLTL